MGEGSIVIIANHAGNGTTIGRVDGFEGRLAEIGGGIEGLDRVNADLEQQKPLITGRDLTPRFGDRIKGVHVNQDTVARDFIDACKEANGDTPPRPPPTLGAA